jgi:hypothetical protein
MAYKTLMNTTIVENMLIKLRVCNFKINFVLSIRTNNAALAAFQDNVVTLPLHNAHWVTLFNLKG